MSRYPTKGHRQPQPRPQPLPLPLPLPNHWRTCLSLICIAILAWVSLCKFLPPPTSSQPQSLETPAYRSTLSLRDEAFVGRILSRHDITRNGRSSFLLEQSLILVERVWAQSRGPISDEDECNFDLGIAFVEVLQGRENMLHIPGDQLIRSNATDFVTTIFDIVAELQDRVMDRKMPQDWSTSLEATTGLSPEALRIVATMRQITDETFDENALLSIDIATAAAMDFLRQKIVPLIRIFEIAAVDHHAVLNLRQTLRQHMDIQRRSLETYRLKAGESVDHELRTTRIVAYWAACILDTYIGFYDIILSLYLGDERAREASAIFLATHERNTRARLRLLEQYLGSRLAELEPLAENSIYESNAGAFFDAFRGESEHILNVTSPNNSVSPPEPQDVPATLKASKSQAHLYIRRLTVDESGEVSLEIFDGPSNVMRNLQVVLEEVDAVNAKAKERHELLHVQARVDILTEQAKMRDELLRSRDQVLEVVLPAWKLVSKWAW